MLKIAVNIMSYDYTVDYFTSRIPLFERQLCKWRDKKAVGLEIGSFEGRSLIWMVENILTHPESLMYSIDPYNAKDFTTPVTNSTFAIFLSQLLKLKTPSKVKLFNGYSSDILPTFEKNHFDFIYVDGSHVPRHSLTDVIMSFLLLKVGGIMICDDFANGTTETGKALLAFANIYEPCIHVVEYSYILIFEKIKDF